MYDMKHLGHMKQLDDNAPEAMQALWAFDKAVFKRGSVDAYRSR